VKGHWLKLLAFSFFICYSSFPAIAQAYKGHRLSIAGHSGVLIPHHTSVIFIQSEGVRTIDMEWAQGLPKNALYSKEYRKPEAGIGLSLADLGNRDALGYAASAYGFFRAPLFRKQARFEPGYKIAFGWSFLNRYYDLHTNFKNVAIGTPGNVYFYIGLDGRIRLSKLAEITLGVGATHHSNGNIKKPNLGVNLFTGSLGTAIYINRSNAVPLARCMLRNRYRNSFFLSGGARSYNMLNNRMYPTFSLVYDFYVRVKPKREWGAGADIFYSEAYSPILKHKGYENINFSNKLQAGLHGGYGLTFNRLTLIIQAGGYVYGDYKEKPVYSRFALRYRTHEHITVQIGLKTHFGVADFVEYGIGYEW